MSKVKPFDFDRYGRRGSRIAGSKLLRAYCRNCGQPMRVLPDPCESSDIHADASDFCSECDGHAKPVGKSFPTDDVTGYQANAIKDMEG